MASPSSRGSLRRHVVLDGALAVIDRVGLDGLTVRALGRELGVAPMTLYTHFDSKRALLDLAFAHLLHRLFVPQGGTTWQAECEASCRRMRRVLLEHPHWIALLTRVSVPVSALDTYERLLGLMSKDGFRPEAALFAFSSIISHAIGSVLVERMMAGTPPIPKQRLTIVKGMLANLPRGSYARVAAVAPTFDRWSFEEVFDVGLHSLIAGLDSRAPRRNRHRRRA
jgi:AcrR family transcriptional regulator